jgi:predicted acetyltransferase
MSDITLTPITANDHDWIAHFAKERWGDDLMVGHDTIYHISRLPGFVARAREEAVGLVTYHMQNKACEIVSIDSIRPGLGIGTLLLNAVKKITYQHGCTRLWLITTNDNLNALRFYQKRGFVLVAVHPNAIERARKVKPQIPLIGDEGIPIRDEIELEWRLREHRTSFLSEPTPQYKESFLEGLREFHAEGRLLQYDVQRVARDFEGFLRHLRNQQQPQTVQPGFVPHTDFWLIDGNEYIGLLTIRPELNDLLFKIGGNIGYQVRPSKRGQGYGKTILRLGLQKAQEMGLPRALVTCDENNIASQKVIEYNGGHFENAVEVEGSPVKKLRYWIDLQ